MQGAEAVDVVLANGKRACHKAWSSVVDLELGNGDCVVTEKDWNERQMRCTKRKHAEGGATVIIVAPSQERD